jgi:hypothetical protein
MKLPAFLIATIACAIKIQTQVEAFAPEFPPEILVISSQERDQAAQRTIEINKGNASRAKENEIMSEMKKMFSEEFGDSSFGRSSRSGEPQISDA